MATPDSSSPKATCHCRRITITLPRPPKEINECRCSLCYKLGALWAYYPRDHVTVTTSSPAFPASTTAFLNSPAPETGTEAAKEAQPITRGVPTGVDEVLDSYVRADLPASRSGGGITFYRCAHCGALTHWWGTSERLGDEGGSIMGVNCRLLPENEISTVTRAVRAL
ncbi:hypothetical protein F4861DRAFT_512656, partial [Xylaria intraflava]